ncbi:terminase family protein [Chitiniphilus purpureus]|uniref:Terminase family protein n=1 Tax=Chitiniphilus purpureus TaxID=2981137 RepID=A0ABY6DQT6_9NEIS|nr:terminase family protein [Chitiniphilus sp. CD1]UXY16740.1 terminase family protein [Chitiniphilus sp. CD1]
MDALTYNPDPRRRAQLLYWQGLRVARIAELIGEKPVTIHSWKRRDQWDQATPADRVDATFEARLIELTLKPAKEGRDFKEIDLLNRQLQRSEERKARVGRYQNGGTEADLNPKVANRNAKPKKAPTRNAITEAEQEALVEAFKASQFEYNKHWYRAGLKHRIRTILKSRQIGATFYFAREALIDALLTGRNQIFISASKSQAYQFRLYMQDFVRETIGIELKGDPIQLPNGAKLYFLGTNFRSTQSYSGNVYIDEIFWIPRFAQLRNVASGMASHERFRQTYFSTPSAISHEAYPFWSGELFNEGRPKDEHITVDTSHAALQRGALCGDAQWRQIVTVKDAIAAGCSFLNMDTLERERNPLEFRQLYMCEFADDATSVFPLSMLQPCMVDSWAEWADVKQLALRPYAYEPVWIGYDPAGSNTGGDSAGCVVLAPPKVPGGPFRVLERHQWKGLDFAAQAEAIRLMTQRYNVQYIGMDITGIGAGVYQLVKQFYPGVRGFNYSADLKNYMVLKAYDVISKRRLQWEHGWTEIPAAFMAIKKTMTDSGRQATYKAGRSKTTSHADLAWSIMHALCHEPLEGESAHSQSFMEIFE